MLHVVLWTAEFVKTLNTALNESTICGLAYDADRSVAKLLIEYAALPEIGPIDTDPRRALVMTGVSQVEVWVRPDARDELGPAIPLESFGDLEELFRSLSYAHSMYGWSFVDDAEPWDAIATQPSLRVVNTARSAAHTLRWFTECGRGEGRRAEALLIAGVIGFADLDVQRADGAHVSAWRFAEDGARWWSAFFARDPRTSAEAQQRHAASAKHWRVNGPAGGIVVL
jgi:hypothetical protein